MPQQLSAEGFSAAVTSLRRGRLGEITTAIDLAPPVLPRIRRNTLCFFGRAESFCTKKQKQSLRQALEVWGRRVSSSTGDRSQSFCDRWDKQLDHILSPHSILEEVLSKHKVKDWPAHVRLVPVVSYIMPFLRRHGLSSTYEYEGVERRFIDRCITGKLNESPLIELPHMELSFAWGAKPAEGIDSMRWTERGGKEPESSRTIVLAAGTPAGPTDLDRCGGNTWMKRLNYDGIDRSTPLFFDNFAVAITRMGRSSFNERPLVDQVIICFDPQSAFATSLIMTSMPHAELEVMPDTRRLYKKFASN